MDIKYYILNYLIIFTIVLLGLKLVSIINSDSKFIKNVFIAIFITINIIFFTGKFTMKKYKNLYESKILEVEEKLNNLGSEYESAIEDLKYELDQKDKEIEKLKNK